MSRQASTSMFQRRLVNEYIDGLDYKRGGKMGILKELFSYTIGGELEDKYIDIGA